jgi:hypothetical protein
LVHKVGCFAFLIINCYLFGNCLIILSLGISSNFHQMVLHSIIIMTCIFFCFGQKNFFVGFMNFWKILVLRKKISLNHVIGYNIDRGKIFHIEYENFMFCPKNAHFRKKWAHPCFLNFFFCLICNYFFFFLQRSKILLDYWPKPFKSSEFYSKPSKEVQATLHGTPLLQST